MATSLVGSARCFARPTIPRVQATPDGIAEFRRSTCLGKDVRRDGVYDLCAKQCRNRLDRGRARLWPCWQ